MPFARMTVVDEPALLDPAARSAAGRVAGNRRCSSEILLECRLESAATHATIEPWRPANGRRDLPLDGASLNMRSGEAPKSSTRGAAWQEPALNRRKNRACMSRTAGRSRESQLVDARPSSSCRQEIPRLAVARRVRLRRRPPREPRGVRCQKPTCCFSRGSIDLSRLQGAGAEASGGSSPAALAWKRSRP